MHRNTPNLNSNIYFEPLVLLGGAQIARLGFLKSSRVFFQPNLLFFCQMACINPLNNSGVVGSVFLKSPFYHNPLSVEQLICGWYLPKEMACDVTNSIVVQLKGFGGNFDYTGNIWSLCVLLFLIFFHLRGSDEEEVLSNGIICEEAVHLQQNWDYWRRLNLLEFKTILEFEMEKQEFCWSPFCCNVVIAKYLSEVDRL